MALEKSGDILRDAYKDGYGVAMFNAFNYETVKLAIQKAEELQKPVLIGFYPGWRHFIDYSVLAGIVKNCASKVKVPIGMHLDHCTDFNEIMRAMKEGFTSVMYDGSILPFEENVKNTIEVVKAAKSLGVDVEAELGHVGAASDLDSFTDSSKFTSVHDAELFLDKTGCSSLAVAVGNAHGDYSRLPNLDLERIAEISQAVKIPLVLHGGSGIPEEQVGEAVKCGIAKMNVATDYFSAYYRAVKTYDSKPESHKNMYSCAVGTQPDILMFLENIINVMNP